MELLCIEPEFEPTASFDPAIMDHERILFNLLAIEERYLITGCYFKCLQTDLKPCHRDKLADWMQEVCEAEHCQREVFPLAMNILDRFLALVYIRKQQFQLLGSVCLLIASKLRQSRPILPEALVEYSAQSCSIIEIISWERLVLSRLKWDVAGVTPNDFVGPLLRRLSKLNLIDEFETRTNMKHVFTLIDLCSADFKFSLMPPSMIAAASIFASLDGLLGGLSQQKSYLSTYQILKSTQILHQLHQATRVEKELLRECQRQIEQKINGLQAPTVFVYSTTVQVSPIDSPDYHCNAPLVNSVDSGQGSPIDCTNFDYDDAALLRSVDSLDCLNPCLFKHSARVVSDSIGVDF